MEEFRIGIDGEARRIAFLHIGEIGLPDVGFDIEIARRYQRKGGLAGIEKGSDGDALDIIGDAVEWRDDGSEPQIACRKVDSRLCLFHGDLLINRHVWVAAELGECRRGLPLQAGQISPRCLKVAYRGIKRRPWRGTPIIKLLLALEGGLRIICRRLGLIDLFEA